MYKIFKLSLATAIRQKSVFLVLLLLAVLPFVLQQMTNFQVDPSVSRPAIAQAAWQLVWAGACFWLVYNAANMGGGHVRSRLGEYFLSGGVTKSSQLCGLWLTTMLFAFLMVVVAVTVCVCAAAPEGETEFRHWLVLNVQHAVFFLVVVSAVNQFVIALASRFGALVGYSGGLFLYLCGFYLVLVVEKIVLSKDIFALDTLYVVLPHFYLADLTHRFVHQQGALTTPEFMGVFEYLAGLSILLSTCAYLTFTPKQK